MKSRIKKISKIIGINITILGILLISPALFYQLYKKLKPVFYTQFNQTLDPRAYYPTYSNKEFSIELFNELSKLRSIYRSFIGWRREKVNFKYTKVSGPYFTRKSKGESIDNSVWFFGGSTMWGEGASDLQTIPSHFNSITNIPVYNFGEPAWNSRQSLNQLINAIGDNNKPSIVLFFDGLNDVIHQCRSEIKLLPSSYSEQYIQNMIKPLPIQERISNFILSPYINIAKKFSIQFSVVNRSQSKAYDCDINKAKALSIAQHLVNNWYTAHIISKSRSFEFYSILQPNLSTTKTNSEYFHPNIVKENLKMSIQYRIVYPLILKEIDKYCEFDKDFCSSFINATDWLDGTNNIFIDFYHINSLGNKVIAKRLKLLLDK